MKLKKPARYIGWALVRGLIWLFRTSIAFAISLVHFRAVRPLVGDAMSCPTCRTQMSLLGLWECGTCGYRFYGFYFARCEACGAVPPWLECDGCGASTMNPLIFG